MAEREKVIKGLRCIAGDVVWCAQCPYSDVNGSGRGDRCKRDCAKDALALLKAQEPRVMTLEEVWKASVASEPIWIELIDVGLLCLPLCAILEDENDNQYAVFTTQYSAIRCPFGKYGKTWRCWTSRPTDEQREATPWNS